MRISKIAATFILLILVAVLIFIFKEDSNNNLKTSQERSSSSDSQDEQPTIISTKPNPLEEAVITASEVIEITFSHSLENADQFKNRLEPKVDYKIVLSQDRKTVKIIPQKPYDLGTTYTLFILPDSKFDGIGQWGKEKIFHFKTIKYRGV